MLNKIIYYFLFIILSPLLSSAVQADPLLRLSNAQSEYSLGKYISVLEDNTGKLRVDDVSQAEFNDQFKTFKEDAPNLGFSESTFWVRLQIKNESATNNWLLVQHFSNTHFLDMFYREKNGESFKIKQSGNLRVVSQRDVKHRLSVFKLTIEPEEEQLIYLRIRSDAVINLNLKLWTEVNFSEKNNINTFWLGLFYGTFFIILSINLLLFVFFKKKNYLYLVFFVISICSAFLFYDGIGQFYFNKNNIETSRFYLPASVSVAMIMLLNFGRSLLGVKFADKQFELFHNILIVLLVITFFMSFIATYHNAVIIIITLALISSLYLIVRGSVNWKIQSGAGKFIVIGILSFFMGFLGLALNKFGLFDSHFEFEQGIRISTVILILFMSLAIVNHIQKLYALKENTSKALTVSEKNYQLLFESAHDAIFLITNNLFVDCNPKTLDIFACQRNEIIGKTPIEFSPEFQPDGRNSEEKAIEKINAALNGKPQLFEWLHTHYDGSLFDAEVSLNKIQINGVNSLQAIVRDITKRKRAEEAINNIATGVSGQVGEVFFQDMVKSLGELLTAKYVFIGLLDDDSKKINTIAVCIDGQIVENMSYKLENTPCASVMGKKMCTYPDSIQQLFPKDKMLKEMEAESYIGTPLYNAEDEAIGLIVILDTKVMTGLDQVQSILEIFSARASAELERKNTERILLNKEREQREILQSMVDGIVTIDEDSKILTFNKAAEVLFSYTADEMIGEHVSRLLPESYTSNFEICLKNYLEMEEEPVNSVTDIKGLRKDSTTFPLRLSIAKLPLGTDGKQRFIGSCLDLTQIKQQEEKLRRTQKMDALGKLTGGIAHDYNNMLGVVMGYAEVLKEELCGQPKLVKYAHQIYHAGERGARLTKKLLSFSRQKVPEAICLNLNDLLRNEQLVLEKTLTVRIKLILELADNLWPVWLDDSDMEDAILNMSINAMHAIEGYGKLSIYTSNQKISYIDALSLDLEQGDYVVLSISDNGCGMSDEIKDNIFEPFFTTKGELGTGLGLSQVYGFVQRSGGAIKVFSEPGHGTRFVLYFPRYHENNQNQQPSEIHNMDVYAGNENILVVDDEPALLSLTCGILAQQGYNIFSANSAQNALDILHHETIDLLISDIIMPEIDGYQLASMVKEKYPAIKIQLISGFPDDSNAGIVDDKLQKNILLKPFSSLALLQRTYDLLKEKVPAA